MENNYLDKAVKDKLQHLEVEYQADTWDLFEQKLAVAEDASTLDDTALDGIVFAVLGEYEAPYEKGHWEAMSERLDDDLIDTTVLGALGNIDVPYQESAWEAMSQRLDDDVLDDTVFDTLNNLGAVYNESHWALMSQRLDAIFARPFEIIRYKLVELAFLFLLIFGVGEFLPTDQPNANIPVAKNDTQQIDLNDAEQISAEQAHPDKSVTEPSARQPAATKEVLYPSKNTDTNRNASVVEKATADHIDKITPSIPTKEGNISPVLSSGSSLAATEKTERDTEKTTATSSTSTWKPIAWLENDQTESVSQMSSLAEKTNTTATTSVNQIPEALLAVNLLNKNIPLLDIPEKENISNSALLHQKEDEKTQIRVGMFGSSNADFIVTPYDPVLGLRTYNRYALGYGGGVSIGWKYNRWELETAISYIAKRYKNRPFVHIYGGSVLEGFQANYLTAIELNMVNIPLHFNYHFVNSGKWHVYGLTGGTMQVVLQANYDANRAELGGGQGTTFSGGTKVSEDNNKSLFSRKNFNNGFFADKNLKENSYYTIDVGMGLERYLSPYWNIFIQPTYQYNLPEPFNTDGLGPNNDKINTFQLLIGVKSNLK